MSSHRNAELGDVVTAGVRIAAPPEVIFGYLTEPELIVKWIGDWADLSAVPGGVFAVDISGTSVRGGYLEVDPPRRVVFTWGVPGDETMPPGSSTVEITLTPDGDETVVEVLHRGLAEEKRAPHAEGWPQCLARLAVAFA